MILLAAAAVALASPAFADSWTAVPVQASNQTGFVGSTITWDCNTSGCRAVSDTSGGEELAECRGVAREVGPLSSFTGSKDAFSADRLTHCNQAARKSAH
jgi:hypothetical protein